MPDVVSMSNNIWKKPSGKQKYSLVTTSEEEKGGKE